MYYEANNQISLNMFIFMNTRVQELFQIFCDYLWSPRNYFNFFWVFSRNQNAEKSPPPSENFHQNS